MKLRQSLRRCGQVPLLGVMMAGHSDCGPCDQEVGIWVLLTLPVLIAVGFAVQWLYRHCWKETRRLIIFNTKSSAAMLAITFSLLLVGLLVRHDGGGGAQYGIEFLYPAMVLGIPFVGTTYLTWLTIVLRVGVQAPRWPWWHRYSVVLPLFMICPFAIWLLIFGEHQGFDQSAIVGIIAWPGALGLVAGPLLALLLAEPLIRSHRAKRKKRLAKQLPQARLL